MLFIQTNQNSISYHIHVRPLVFDANAMMVNLYSLPDKPGTVYQLNYVNSDIILWISETYKTYLDIL